VEKNDDYVKDYPLPDFNFRVLFYTSKGEGRARNLIEAIDSIRPGGRNQWLFTWLENLRSADNILQAEWITGKGESATLSD